MICRPCIHVCTSAQQLLRRFVDHQRVRAESILLYGSMRHPMTLLARYNGLMSVVRA